MLEMLGKIFCIPGDTVLKHLKCITVTDKVVVFEVIFTGSTCYKVGEILYFTWSNLPVLKLVNKN